MAPDGQNGICASSQEALALPGIRGSLHMDPDTSVKGKEKDLVMRTGELSFHLLQGI